MYETPAHVRRAQNVHISILQMLAHHRTKFLSEPSSEYMCIYLSVEDARTLDEEQSRVGGEFHIPSKIKDGDTGTLAGLQYSVDGTLKPGTAYIGYRVVAPSFEDVT